MVRWQKKSSILLCRAYLPLLHGRRSMYLLLVPIRVLQVFLLFCFAMHLHCHSMRRIYVISVPFRILYGSHSIDSLVNSGISQLLERFLFMRPVAICNAYMQCIRAEHSEVGLALSLSHRNLSSFVLPTVSSSRKTESIWTSHSN